MHDPFSLNCSLHDPHLYDTRNGRILRCNCCRRIQIEFRGLTLLVDEEGFETLLRTVVEVLDEIEGEEAGSWRHAAPTDAGEVSATLDRSELRALYELLAEAKAMRTLNERLPAVVEGHRRERPASVWPR